MLTTRLIRTDSHPIIKRYSIDHNYYHIQSKGNKRIKTEWITVRGKLCKDLGLNPGQTINEQTFTNLLHGRNSTGEKVTQKHKVHGIDLTFSAPKSVSIAALVTDRNPDITKAHDTAVLETMKEIEAKHSYVRPTSTTKMKTDKMIYVTVRNGLSNSLDPHLHTHAIIMNISKGNKTNDKIMGLHTKEIIKYGFNKTWGTVYRNKLVHILIHHGYDISHTNNGFWRLTIINLKTEKEFSQRNVEIGKAKTKGSNSFNAWRITRSNKQSNYSINKIHSNWNKRIKGTGGRVEGQRPKT